MRRVLSVAGGLVLMAALGTAAAQPTPPTRFYGTAQMNGAPAPNGTVISAYLGSTNCGTAMVRDGAYTIDVASAGTKPGCGTDGADVAFEIGSARASQTGIFQIGAFVPLNLSASGDAQPSATASPTPTTRPSASPTARATGTAAPSRTPTASGDAALPQKPTPPAHPSAQAQRPAGSPQAQVPAPAPVRTGTAAPAPARTATVPAARPTRAAGAGTTPTAGPTPRLPATGAAPPPADGAAWLLGGLAVLLALAGASVTLRQRR